MSLKIKKTEVGIYLLLWIILTIFLLYLIYDYKTPFLHQFLATLVVTRIYSFSGLSFIKSAGTKAFISETN